jgi:Tol biopolymer transport system component
MDADGANQTQITTSKRHEFAPTFSPTGTRVAFNRVDRAGRVGVWTMPADASSPPRQWTVGPNDFFPDWQQV